jgi:hypothetical protein|tara:strand:- start:523 stop:684 length:162 start_codon:yes stop_codon:yes gene_type:complete
MTARWPISHSLVLDSVAALAAGFAVTVDTEEDTWSTGWAGLTADEFFALDCVL